MAIVNLMDTYLDSKCSVRIYAKIDDVFRLLIKELGRRKLYSLINKDFLFLLLSSNSIFGSEIQQKRLRKVHKNEPRKIGVGLFMLQEIVDISLIFFKRY